MACSNTNVVAYANQISSLSFRAASLRAQAERAEGVFRQQLEQDASEFDNEICQLCCRLRVSLLDT